jgi:hypothetical protein
MTFHFIYGRIKRGRLSGFMLSINHKIQGSCSEEFDSVLTYLGALGILLPKGEYDSVSELLFELFIVRRENKTGIVRGSGDGFSWSSH